jgi:hypothetical protein
VGLLAYTPSLLLLFAASLFVFERDKRLTGRLYVLGAVAVAVALALTVTRLCAWRRGRARHVLSPWEQGRRIGEIEQARHADEGLFHTFAAAERNLRFDTPAIKVASAEADSAATLSLDDELIAEMRSLIAQCLRR